MMRVPFKGTGHPLLIFTTHDPDTGSVANADSTPTVTVRNAYSPWSSIGGDVAVTNIETGVYAVTFVDDAWGANYSIADRVLVIVSATVGGVTQKLVELCEPVPDTYGGEVESWVGNNDTTFRVKLFSQHSAAAIDTPDGHLLGSLIAFAGDGNVRRITALANVSSTTALVTVDSALPGAPTGFFWVITI
ncbi:MAG TPA: hypothetical protein PK095_00685 [Myxococcota bacterium]|nr:hypothetical protein [Myxococcota bacterium]